MPVSQCHAANRYLQGSVKAHCSSFNARRHHDQLERGPTLVHRWHFANPHLRSTRCHKYRQCSQMQPKGRLCRTSCHTEKTILHLGRPKRRVCTLLYANLELAYPLTPSQSPTCNQVAMTGTQSPDSNVGPLCINTAFGSSLGVR